MVFDQLLAQAAGHDFEQRATENKAFLGHFFSGE